VKRVGMLVFDGFDLMDLVGPYEVILTANRLAARRGEDEPFEIVTVSAGGPLISAYGGLQVKPQAAADTAGHLDVVIVPGTIDVDAALADTDLVATVGRLGAAAATTTSVCTGSFLLAAAGLLAGRTATTHHEDVAALAERDDVGSTATGVRWVDDGEVITAAGISSGIAFGLHLVDRFAGREMALACARQIEHPWDPDGHDVVPAQESPDAAVR